MYMGEIELAPARSAETQLVSEVEAFLAKQATPAAQVLPAVWSGPVLRDYVEQVRVVPTAGLAQVLTGAIDLIGSEGWTRGHYSDSNGFCLMGAIEDAGQDAGFETVQAAKLCTELALVASTGDLNAIAWNDDLRRTKDDVQGLLASAVIVARALGGR